MATWVWCYMTMLMIILMWVMPSFSIEEVDSKLGVYATIKYDLNTGKDGYSKFLTSFRNTVSTTRVCDIQTTSSVPNYIYVELQSSPTKTITIGLDTKDLYVWGYKDNAKYGGKIRARFFKEVSADAYEKLFPGTDIKTKTRTSVRYDSMV
ncbi:antiviral protein MAP-like isoform X1 [Amaranthus tricolor]|uniref:antiviral protein MAP-like isoform X1 n=1 Tax=Amaranthus tricolor TaxID=29722 RepID=UPI00258F337E|nr:antiviral protein MAP-like isoform X1 [Amaranthus tricolor]XP_057523465.1 antiviral protein MAP-like isoform X1 [Amaranthus tricolor]